MGELRPSAGAKGHAPAGACGADPASLPADIAFLAAEGVPERVLRNAARLADLRGTSARQELLSLGFPAGRYWAALARHLGLVFSADLRACELDDDTPADLRSPTRLAVRRGAVRLVVLAPDARLIAALRQGLAARPAMAQDILIASPETMRALVLRHRQAHLARAAVTRLSDFLPRLSANPAGRLAARKEGPLALSAAFMTLFAAFPGPMLHVTAWVLALLFLNCVAWKCAAAFRRAPALRAEAVASRHLPTYSVLVPLHREAAVLPDLVANLAALDYPASKLQVLLVVEADDSETGAALASLTLPAVFEVVRVPPGNPRTKPKALSYALPFATGDYVVVFDAEDRPEPDQLRRAVAAFRHRPDLGCVQARLTPDHAGSLLPRFFALDYAATFEVLLPALASWGLPLPLGGTSNHFPRAVLERIGGWDPFNVTEDADIGIRLARFGYRAAVIQSRTYEEAPVLLGQWLAQRRRWIKGWMQTATVALPGRAPAALRLRLRDQLAVHGVITGGVVGLLLYPLSLAVLFYSVTPWAEGAWPQTVEGWALIAVNACNLAGVLIGSAVAAARGACRTGAFRLLWLIPFLPLYWGLMSLAAWQAAWQFITSPSTWEKTPHGLARDRRTPRMAE